MFINQIFIDLFFRDRLAHQRVMVATLPTQGAMVAILPTLKDIHKENEALVQDQDTLHRYNFRFSFIKFGFASYVHALT